MVSKTSEPIASNYAMHKIDNFDYVELWYWTKEGCEEAQTNDVSDDPNTLTLSKVEEQVVLKPINVSKPSSRAVPDRQLLWNQLSIGKAGMLKQMTKSGWPSEHLTSLGAFYLELKSHNLRHELLGKLAVIAYADEVRQEWFQALKPNSTKACFDIGVINEDRLDSIHRRILNQRQGRLVEMYVFYSCLTKEWSTDHFSSLCLCNHDSSLDNTVCASAATWLCCHCLGHLIWSGIHADASSPTLHGLCIPNRLRRTFLHPYVNNASCASSSLINMPTTALSSPMDGSPQPRVKDSKLEPEARALPLSFTGARELVSASHFK